MSFMASSPWRITLAKLLIRPTTFARSVLLVDDPQPLEREERLDALDRGALVRDQAREPARRDHARGAELLADPVDHRVDEARGAVEQSRLHGAGGGLADHRLRPRDLDAVQPRRALEQRLHRRE